MFAFHGFKVIFSVIFAYYKPQARITIPHNYVSGVKQYVRLFILPF